MDYIGWAGSRPETSIPWFQRVKKPSLPSCSKRPRGTKCAPRTSPGSTRYTLREKIKEPGIRGPFSEEEEE